MPTERDAGHVYHLFPLLGADRESLRARLTAGGIETLIHYPVPIPRQPALAADQPRQCPVADRVCEQVFSVPLYPALLSGAVDLVARALRGA